MQPDDQPSTRMRGLLQRLEDNCRHHVDRVSVALYGLQNERVVRDRTGVLYRVADHHFILTAAHDLRGIVQNHIPLFLLTDTRSDPIPLVDCKFHTTEVDDGRDVAAIKLSDDCVDAIGNARDFLPHSRVDLCDDSDGFYLVFGYPEAWTTKSPQGEVSSQPLVFLTQCYDGKRHSTVFFDERVHIALRFETNAAEIRSGNAIRLPALSGISGCGIWRVGDCGGQTPSCWSPEQIRLVALQHRLMTVECGTYLQGTLIRYVLSLIRDNYPVLQPAMSLVYPRPLS